jgi:hypothetical protein
VRLAGPGGGGVPGTGVGGVALALGRDESGSVVDAGKGQ